MDKVDNQAINKVQIQHPCDTKSMKRHDKDKVIRKCREYFKQMDTNGDGQIDAHEFAQMMEYIGMDLDKSELQRAYDKADQDGNGSISFREFYNSYCNEEFQEENDVEILEPLPGRSATHTDKYLTEGFKYFWNCDTDIDGRLSLSEFATLLSLLDMKRNRRDIKKAFKIADTDGDGFISFAEFIKTFINKITSKTMTSDKLKQIYWKNDIDNKGYLSCIECGDVLRTLGCDLHKGLLEQLVKAIDKDENGRITLNNFCQFLGLHQHGPSSTDKDRTQSEKRTEGYT